jgi:hypothetical protein
MDLKVGSTIYRRNGVAVVITGETKVSWIVGEVKIKKSAMSKGNSGERWVRFFVAQQDALDCMFAQENRYSIGRLVQDCEDGIVLRKIAHLIGYTEAE